MRRIVARMAKVTGTFRARTVGQQRIALTAERPRDVLGTGWHRQRHRIPLLNPQLKRGGTGGTGKTAF